MIQHVLCSCVLYDLFECEQISYNYLILEIFFFSSMETAAIKYLPFKKHSCMMCNHPNVLLLHQNISCAAIKSCWWVTCKWVSQWQNSTEPGKIIEAGHLVTPRWQTSLHQSTFRCSDWVDQDIEVNWLIWLAEPGDWGHSAERRGNKVSPCVTAPESGMLLRKCSAKCRESKNQ